MSKQELLAVCEKSDQKVAQLTKQLIDMSADVKSLVSRVHKLEEAQSASDYRRNFIAKILQDK